VEREKHLSGAVEVLAGRELLPFEKIVRDRDKERDEETKRGERREEERRDERREIREEEKKV
jgi:hypothetical protein